MSNSEELKQEELKQEDQSYLVSSKLTRRKMLTIATGALLLPVVAKNGFLQNTLGISTEAYAKAHHAEYPAIVKEFFAPCINAAAGHSENNCLDCLLSIRSAFHKVGAGSLNELMNILQFTYTVSQTRLDLVTQNNECVNALQMGNAPCSTISPAPTAVMATFTQYMLCLAGALDDWDGLKSYEKGEIYRGLATVLQNAIG